MYYEEPKKGNKTLIFLTIGVIVLGLIIFGIVMVIINSNKKPQEPVEKEVLGCELEVNGNSIAENTYIGETTVSFKSKSPANVASFGIGTSKTYNKKDSYLLKNTGEATVYGYVKDLDGNEAQCSVKVTIKAESELYCALGIKEGKKGINDWYTSDVEIEFTLQGKEGTVIENQGIIGYSASEEIDEEEEEDLENIEVPYSTKETYLVTKDGITEVYGKIEDENGSIAVCKLVVKKASTPPKCTLKVTSGTKNGNAYTSNVTVELDDIEEGLTAITGQGVGVSKNYDQKSYTVTNNGTTKVYGYVSDEAGNEGTCELEIVKGTTSNPNPQPNPNPNPNPQPNPASPTCSLKINSGTMGSNGWYRSNVVVGFSSSTANLSFGIATSKIYDGQATKTITADGTTQMNGYVKNSSGGEGSCPLTIKKDSTKPICSLKVVEVGSNGVYNSQATVVFDTKPTDAISGVSAYGIGTSVSYNKNDSFVVTTAGTHTITGYVKDNAGNEGTCSINITVNINTLAKMAKVGDYVAYDAGTFAATKAFPVYNNAAHNFTFGGYNSGNSRNTRTINCENQSQGTVVGWRILNISGDVVTLIHGGIPECYSHPSISGQTTLGYNSEKILSGTTIGVPSGSYTSTPRNWSEYVNSTYATSATAFTKPMLDTYLTLPGASVNDSLIKLGTPYYLGTASSGSALYAVSALGATSGYSYRVFGIRPVVVLKNTIKTDGKNASGAWTIKN